MNKRGEAEREQRKKNGKNYITWTKEISK